MFVDTRSITQEIKSFGIKLGFSHVGIASPHLSINMAINMAIWAQRFRYWLEKGFCGEMGYMKRDVEKRTALVSIFPDVKSVVVAAMNCYPGEGHMVCLENPEAGYIASYALNEDYHRVIYLKLKELLQCINKITDAKVDGRIYVDTGSVLEKPLAVMAGIGWMGKNTLLIGKETGSWLILGVLLLDVELDFDEPEIDQCGECNRCLEACPTKAIVNPHMLDARRCISYLLGELKGQIPVDMRPSIGNRIFGCDDCQWVCPWNRDAGVSTEKAFMPRFEMMAPKLIDLMEMDEDRFRSVYNNSPVRRIKRGGFLRNVAVALGNSGDRMAIPVLEKRLKDPDPVVREHVDWALGRL